MSEVFDKFEKIQANTTKFINNSHWIVNSFRFTFHEYNSSPVILISVFLTVKFETYILHLDVYMSISMTKPTTWLVWQAKAQNHKLNDMKKKYLFEKI